MNTHTHSVTVTVTTFIFTPICKILLKTPRPKKGRQKNNTARLILSAKNILSSSSDQQLERKKNCIKQKYSTTLLVCSRIYNTLLFNFFSKKKKGPKNRKPHKTQTKKNLFEALESSPVLFFAHIFSHPTKNSQKLFSYKKQTDSSLHIYLSCVN